jgi:hypothetical protein
MEQEQNPVAHCIADITGKLAMMAKAARLEALSGILKVAHVEARGLCSDRSWRLMVGVPKSTSCLPWSALQKADHL